MLHLPDVMIANMKGFFFSVANGVKVEDEENGIFSLHERIWIGLRRKKGRNTEKVKVVKRRKSTWPRPRCITITQYTL